MVGTWDVAAAALVKVAAPAPELVPLPVDKLRLLQDALVRDGAKLGPAAGVARAQVDAELQAKGVAAARVAPGAAYGNLVVKPSPPIDGDPAAGTPYSNGMAFEFWPDLTVVDADQIAFIQSVRVVESASGNNLDPSPGNQARQTARHTSVDKTVGEQGWYAMDDDKTGNDLGKVYAIVQWGFKVDGRQKITPTAPVVTNKPTREFAFAVTLWNAQAAGPAADRNAPNQQPLPALR